MSVQVIVNLPEPLAEEARAAGLLSSERIAALLVRELRCEDAWDQFGAAAALVREASAADYRSLSDDEILRIVDEEIDQMRAVKRSRNASAADPEL